MPPQNKLTQELPLLNGEGKEAAEVKDVLMKKEPVKQLNENKEDMAFKNAAALMLVAGFTSDTITGNHYGISFAFGVTFGALIGNEMVNRYLTPKENKQVANNNLPEEKSRLLGGGDIDDVNGRKTAIEEIIAQGKGASRGYGAINIV